MQQNVNPNIYTRKGDALPSFPESWARSEVKEIGDIDFCVIDIVYRIQQSPHPLYDTRKSGEVAVVDLHGIDREGHSITLHAHNYEPFFYCSIPSNFEAGNINLFKSSFNNALSGTSKNPDVPPIRHIEIVEKRNIMFYQPNEKERFLKVTTQLPKYVSACRKVIEERKVLIPGAPNFCIQTFESNVDFVLRFMNDRDITGCSWVSIKKDKYTERSLKEKKTHSQIEIDANYLDVESHETENEWMEMPKLRILSFDIEVGGEADHFPTPDKDPVIQICAYFQIQGDPEPLFSIAFVLGTCSKLVGSALYQFEDEGSLLLAWHKFFRYVDPDIVTGYNIANFDWTYLVQRAKVIGCNEFCALGRYLGEYSEAKEVKKNIKVLGLREGKEVDIPGVIVYDMLVSIQTDYKLRSYTLNAVSAHFLNDQKEDVHYSMISTLQKGTAHDRHRLAVYCIKDAYLPLQLMNKLLSIFTSVELARVCHVPMNYLLNRGQQIRVFSQLLHKANKRNMIIPAVRSAKADTKYEGATVINPKANYYRNPIPTLDFASLYPSIMIAHNLCYSTLVKDSQKLSVDDYDESPTQAKFVKSHVFHGVLPDILKELIDARKKTRVLEAQEKDPLKQNVLHCRQLALKVSANSVYGFTGATVGKLPCLTISEAVTGYGRKMIKQTQKIVEEKYTIKEGYSADAQVIYGDTDSVMVNFGPITLAEAIERGKEAAAYVSNFFPNPIHLEFEKAYQPFLLISKKHYAGFLHTSVDAPGRIDAKGIETVRRDNCRLVQNLLQKSLNILLIENDTEKAIKFVKSVISDLLTDKIDLSFLVISKALTKKDYKAKQPHVELANKMEKRNPGSAPRLGDRIAYVIVASGKSSKAYEKSEEPIYALEHGIQIDTKYYLENQLKKPIERLFTPIMGSQHVNDLLGGEHTRHIKQAMLRPSAGKSGTLMGFVQIRETCICGKSPVDKGKKPVCSYCKDKITDIYEDKMKEYRAIEEEHTKLWANCQRCQKSLMTQNICTACDCPIFYRRKKTQLDLEDMYKALKKFDNLLKFQ